MRKKLTVLLSLLLSAVLLASCAGKKPPEPAEDEGPRHIDVLRVVFVPSQDPQEILETTAPLAGLLKSALAARGFEVGSVELTVGETYEAVGDTLAAGGADVAVGMPGGTYVLYDDVCDVILTSTRNGLSKDYERAKDWNDEMPTVSVDIQTVFYRALLIAGPSDKGRELAKKVNSGAELTWEDIDSANWSIMSTSSSAGYIYPSLWLEGNYGKGVTDLSHTVTSSSYSEAFSRLASGEADALMTYADARRDFASDWNADFGREESIWGETDVIGVTPGIYNDTVTVSRASPIMDDALREALQNAFIDIADNSTEGKKAIAIYNHKGYQKAVPADYDNERAAQRLIQSLGGSNS